MRVRYLSRWSPPPPPSKRTPTQSSTQAGNRTTLRTGARARKGREGRVLRAAGVGHSPSDLACTNDFILRMMKMDKLLEVNQEKLYVVVQVGITLFPSRLIRVPDLDVCRIRHTLTALHAALGQHDLAMRSLGSISGQTLGGIVATASHGSGIAYRDMSADVFALTLLFADGTRTTCEAHRAP
ncbi:hypothetical protein DFH09DRAFT_1331428 [Mycena vulgaris]|nr:hypothetical protein DFH09DRAFT_1331428 [Mycena vulgaris]